MSLRLITTLIGALLMSTASGRDHLPCNVGKQAKSNKFYLCSNVEFGRLEKGTSNLQAGGNDSFEVHSALLQLS